MNSEGLSLNIQIPAGLLKTWSSGSEERDLKTLLVLSALVHLFILVFGSLFFSGENTTIPVTDWQIEASLSFDNLSSQTDESALPRAKEAKEMAVEETILPQLPKTFSVDEAKKPEKGLNPENIEAGSDNIKNDSEITSEQKDDPSNKIQMDDAIKRLALEKLRLDQKFAKTRQAEKNDPLAKLRSKLKNSDQSKVEGSAGLGSDALSAYQKKVKSHLRPLWKLPEGYSFRNSEIIVSIAVILDGAGHVLQAKIAEPSGDDVFDQETLKIINAGSPYPTPPEEQIGKTMLVRFTPKSF